MAHLLVPPSVARELAEETRQFAGVIDPACHQDRTCLEWTRELVRLDPHLSMVKAPDCQVVGTPLVPGAYHVKRDNPGAPPSLIPIRDEEGRPIHPPGRLLDQLKAMDAWNTNVREMQDRIRRVEEERQQRARENLRAERQENILDQYKSVTETSISMNTDTPWTQNASPAARRDAAVRKARKDKG